MAAARPLHFEPLSADLDAAVSVEEAQQQLADYLVDMKMSARRMTAKDVCILMWWAKIAGLRGLPSEFAFDPGAQSGKFSRHFNSVLGLDKDVEGSYALRVPRRHATDESASLDLPCLCLQEFLAAEIDESPDLESRLEETVRGGEWSAEYYNHPVVTSAAPGEVVWPLGIYCDKVPFVNRDSALVFYVYNLVSRVRHMPVVVRGSDMCDCGCQGWCTIYPVMVFLRWCVDSLAEGRLPRARHDGTSFTGADAARAAMAGEAGIKGAIIDILGDWSEIAHTWGVPDWSNVFHPCFCCFATRDELGDLGDLDVANGPRPTKTHVDYVRACAACDKTFAIPDDVSLARLVGCISYGERGAELGADLPEYGGKLGDLLVPSMALPDLDVRRVQDIRVFPVEVKFWRRANQTVATRCNPFLGAEVGITLESFRIDTLHTLHLGTWKAFCMTCVWAFILGDVWETKAPNQEMLIRRSFDAFRRENALWNASERKRLGHNKVYEVQRWTMPMLGVPTSRTLATKAAETGTLLDYCVAHLPGRVSRIAHGEALLAVGEGLRRTKNVMRDNPRVLPPHALQELLDSVKRAFSCREAAGIPWTPKWHLMLHLASKARVAGNPRFYSTFVDEDFNGRVAKIACACHRLTWYRGVMSHFRVQYSSASRRRNVKSRKE